MNSTTAIISGSPALQSRMHELYEKRMKRYTVVLIDEFPSVFTVHEPIILGSFSWTLPKSKQRWIIRGKVVDIGFGPQTAPEIARDYIDAAFPRKLRAYNDQIALIKQHRSPAMFCNPGRIIKGVYVDINAAYWSIAKLVGYNVDYFPGKWLGQGRHMEDFPIPQHKIARNSIVSMGLMRPMRMYDGNGKMVEMNKGNPRVNFGLWSVVQDVLHGIAFDLLKECDLRYVNTDGFIIPYHHLKRATEIIFERWALPFKIKNDNGKKAVGMTYVHAVGRYRVGEAVTKNIAYGGNEHFSNLKAYVSSDWLSERIRFCRIQRGSVDFSPPT